MDKSVEKRSIMDYLPEHERVKLRKLVERLAQQTQQKQKFQKLYQQMCNKYDDLNKKYQELEQHCSNLKAQITTSRMAINKAKQAYIASKSAKKIKRIVQAEQIQPNQTQKKTELQTLKQTWLKIPKSSQSKALNEAQSSTRKQYIFQQCSQPINTLTQTLQKQKTLPNIPLPSKGQHTTSKKLINQIPSYRNDTNISTSNKKEQIMNLRKQIQSLTEDMRRKEASAVPLNEKIKKCEQIKNRYLKSKEKSRRKNNHQDSQSNSGSQSDDEKSKQKNTKKTTSHRNRKQPNKNIKYSQLKQMQNEEQNIQKSSGRRKRKASSEQQDQSQENENHLNDTQKRGIRNSYKKNSYSKMSEKIDKKSKHSQKSIHFREQNEYQRQQQQSQEQRKQEYIRQKGGSKHSFKSNKRSEGNLEKKTNKVADQAAQNIKKVNSQRNKPKNNYNRQKSNFDQTLFAIIDQLNS